MADIQHIGQLKPDPKNARRHTARNIGMIVDALHEVGAARSIVIDENYRILAGNGTIDAAAEAGIEKMLVVPVDGETIVAVQRTGLTEAQKTRLALYDNRASDTAEWDASVLAVMAEDGVKLDDLWVPDELDALLADVGQTPEPGDGGDEFDTTPEDGPTTCQPGDLWALGPHRLLCGDSTKAEDVARLMAGEKAAGMWTDPPYGVSYVGGTKAAMTIANDTAEGLETLLDGAFACATFALDSGAPFYIAHPAGALCLTFGNAILRAGWKFHQTLIWVKDSLVLGHSDYHFKHEPIYYGWTQGEGRSGRGNHDGSRWHGNHAQTSVFEVDRPKRSDDHPTEKPLALIEPMLQNSTRLSEVVYDPFLGSGTTLIAAHRTGRKCYGIEIEPKYCDVILKRYTAETGDEPKLLERTHGTAAETAR